MSCCTENIFQPGFSEVLCANDAGAARNIANANPQTAEHAYSVLRRRNVKDIGASRVRILLLYRAGPKKKKARTLLSGPKEFAEYLAGHSRRWFRQSSRRGLVHALAAACLRCLHRNDRFYSPQRHRKILAFAGERQALLLFVVVNANQVAEMHLFGSQQIRERIDDVAFDRALQMPRTVPLIGSFL